ncbi:MAG: diguanylate cyclase [Erysipelotrichaceae bacterium]
MSIKKTLKLIIVINSIALVLVTSFLWVGVFSTKSAQQQEENIGRVVDIVVNNLNEYFDEQLSMLDRLAQAAPVFDILKNPQDVETNTRLQLYLDNTVMNNDCIYNFGIFNMKNERLYSKRLDSTFYLTDFSRLLQGNHIRSLGSQRLLRVVDIAYPIYLDGSLQGYILMELTNAELLKFMKDAHVFTSGSLVIADEDGVVYASNSKVLKSNLYESVPSSNFSQVLASIDFKQDPSGELRYRNGNRERMGYYVYNNTYGYILVYGTDYMEFLAPVMEALAPFLLFILGITTFLVLLYIYIYKRVSLPFEHFVESIKSIRNGDLDERYSYDQGNEFGVIVSTVNTLLDQLLTTNKQLEIKQMTLDMVHNNLPGGLYVSLLSKHDESARFRIEYMSESLLQLTGYSREEIHTIFDDSMLGLMSEEDANRIVFGVKADFMTNGDVCKSEYRIRCKDGCIVWVHDFFRIVEEEGHLYAYGMVSDVTESIERKDELSISEERYRIILEHVGDLIFEWDHRSNSFAFPNAKNNAFGLVDEVALLKSIVYEDLPIYEAWLKSLPRAREKDSFVMQIATPLLGGHYVELQSYPMFDHAMKLIKTICVLRDVDHQMQEKLHLIELTHRDQYTMLLNKKSFESYVKEASDVKGYLVVIDIDDFKQVNDVYGHQYGDFVIQTLAHCMHEYFGDSVLGRIGGDEFGMFVMLDHESLHHQLQKFQSKFQALQEQEENHIPATLSIGISSNLTDTSFSERYQQADEALYEAKEKGKNQFAFHG